MVRDPLVELKLFWWPLEESKSSFFFFLPIYSSRYLGGKFGACLVEELGVENMADIQQFSKKCLQEKFGDKDGYVVMCYNWCFDVLYLMADFLLDQREQITVTF